VNTGQPPTLARCWHQLLTRAAAIAVCALVAVGCGSGATETSRRAQTPDHPAADPKICRVHHGRIVASRFNSQTFGRQRVRIYLPPGYQPGGKRRYPVLYLLHGAATDETQWEDVGIGQGADCLLAARLMPPTLLVLLDAGIAERRPNGANEVERFVLQDVLPMIDRRFPTVADRQHRAIGGISLGGGWSLQIAADRPSRFSAVGGHSPAATLTAAQRASLARHRVRLWLDVGTHDGLRARVADLAKTVQDVGGDVTLHVCRQSRPALLEPSRAGLPPVLYRHLVTSRWSS